jgi:integrase
MDEAADRFEFTTPTTNIKRLRVRKVDVDPFSLQDVQSILATVRPDYRHYFTVRFFTGMRTGEVHGLKWRYVDFDRRLILVRETFVLGEDEYTKTDGSQRDIQMSQPVFEALARQYEATGKLSDYVFCNLMRTPGQQELHRPGLVSLAAPSGAARAPPLSDAPHRSHPVAGGR